MKAKRIRKRLEYEMNQPEEGVSSDGTYYPETSEESEMDDKSPFCEFDDDLSYGKHQSSPSIIDIDDDDDDDNLNNVTINTTTTTTTTATTTTINYEDEHWDPLVTLNEDDMVSFYFMYKHNRYTS
jgi:hypothetical protein